jgi:pSer/pThr/pTyr-binding forkhead associated (FHA) protein
MFGELVPCGGGDPIPLLKKSLLVGRRESCDIVLRFANVSSHHCQLTLENGYWYVKDLNSRNGIKVNDVRVPQKLLSPGDELSVAKHKYVVDYAPFQLGAVGPPPQEMETPAATEALFKKSLLERAGLSGKDFRGMDAKPTHKRGDLEQKRFDLLNDDAGQIRNPNDPV